MAPSKKAKPKESYAGVGIAGSREKKLKERAKSIFEKNKPKEPTIDDKRRSNRKHQRRTKLVKDARIELQKTESPKLPMAILYDKKEDEYQVASEVLVCTGGVVLAGILPTKKKLSCCVRMHY